MEDMRKKTKVCICEPFLISGLLPTLTAPILKGALTNNGFTTQILYPSLKFYVENRIDNNQLFLELIDDIPLQVCDLLFKADQDFDEEIYFNILPIKFSKPEYVKILRCLKRQAKKCLMDVVDEIVEINPEIVALSLTFGGYSFAIRLFDLVKNKLPNIKIVVGGSNCVPEMCSELILEIPNIDYVICDESAESLIELTRFIVEGEGRIPKCVYYRGSDNTEYSTLSTLNELPYPLFDDYLNCANKLGISKDMITLPFEIARGCWWGEKEPCKMCGFFGKRKCYLAKSPKRIIDELTEIVNVYGIHKFRMTDLVQPPLLLLEQIQQIKELNLKIFWEIRPDITENEISILRDMGMTFAQVGLESFSTEALRCINKGTTGIHNIEVLVWAGTYKINVVWNYLYGMEQESDEWYKKIIHIIPSLYHLQPPVPRKIWINKYSTWADEKLEDSSLSFFLVDDRQFDERIAMIYEDLVKGIERWRLAYKRGFALYINRKDRECLHIVKKYEKEEHYKLFGIDRIVYESVRKPATIKDIVKKTNLEIDVIERCLEYFVTIGIVVGLDDKYLALATDDSRYKWVRGIQQTLSFTLDKSYYMKPDINGNIVSVSPICGCSGGCAYCYIIERNLSQRKENLFTIDQTVDYLRKDSRFNGGRKGQYIIVGGWGEIFPRDKKIREISIRWILKLIELGNPVVLASKGDLTGDEILLLKKKQKYESQLFLLESVTTLSSWKEIEVNCISPFERLHFLKKWKEYGLSGTLMLNPYIPGVSDRDLESIVAEVKKCDVDEMILSPLFVSESIISKLSSNPIFKDILNVFFDLKDTRNFVDKERGMSLKALEADVSYTGLKIFKHYSCVLCRQYGQVNAEFYGKSNWCVNCGNCLVQARGEIIE